MIDKKSIAQILRLGKLNSLHNFLPSVCYHHLEDGGGERDRTDDLLNANQALSQLSYTPVSKKWWAKKDLNFRPHAYQARALTN